MKFWIDENIPRPLSKALERAGYKVFAAPARSSDPTILRLAVKENAVILVEPRYPVVEHRAPLRSRTTGFLDSRVLDTCCR